MKEATKEKIVSFVKKLVKYSELEPCNNLPVNVLNPTIFKERVDHSRDIAIYGEYDHDKANHYIDLAANKICKAVKCHIICEHIVNATSNYTELTLELYMKPKT